MAETTESKGGGERYIVGIDAGSVSLNGVVINDREEIVRELPYRRHLGRPEREVQAVLEEIYRTLGPDSIRAVAFTGNHGRGISERLGAYFEFETISQVLGAVHVRPDVRTMISMGGQDTPFFRSTTLERDGSSTTSTPTGPAPRGRGRLSTSRLSVWLRPSTNGKTRSLRTRWTAS